MAKDTNSTLHAGGCSDIKSRKACRRAPGCALSNRRCVARPFRPATAPASSLLVPGKIVRVNGEYCKIVRVLPGNRLQVQSLEDMRRYFRTSSRTARPGGISRRMDLLVLPSGEVVHRKVMKPLYHLSDNETVYLYNGQPVLLRDGMVDRHASQRSILALLHRLGAQGRARENPVNRPRCNPFMWNDHQACRDRGYRGGCGSNKYPTHCNPDGAGSSSQRIVHNWQHHASACKARCRAQPERTKDQRRAKHNCFVNCKKAEARQ